MKPRTLALLAVPLLCLPVFSGMGSAVEGEPVQVDYYWNGETGINLNHTVYDRPEGILQDGGSLNERVETGDTGQNYLESVYLATGAYHKGIVTLSPIDGSFHQNQISDVIPSDFGDIVASPAIYSIKGNTMHNATIFIASLKGNVMAVNASVVWPNPMGSDAQQTVYDVDYSPVWNVHLNGSVACAPSVFYGKDGNHSADRIIFATESGDVKVYSPQGKMLWNVSLNGSGFFSPVPDEYDNLVIVGSGNGYLRGINASSGEIVWNKMFADVTALKLSSRYRDNGGGTALLAATRDGKILKIDPRNGGLKNQMILWEACPVNSLFVTHDGGSIYAGISVIMNGTWLGKGRIYFIDASRMEIKWYQNTSGNLSGDLIFTDSLGYACAVTDSGYFYEFDNMGRIAAKFTLSAEPFPYLLFAPYIPGHLASGFIAVSENGRAISFSHIIVYYGSPAEPLISHHYEEKALWNPGDSWGYKWSMDFARDKKHLFFNESYRSANYTMTGKEGGYSKMMFIKYIGKDNYGYRFDFKGGAYAKGNILLNIIETYTYGGRENTMETNYSIDIYRYEYTFNGSFWLDTGSYADSKGERVYFGVSREKMDMEYVSKTRIDSDYLFSWYHRNYSYMNEDNILLRNFTLEYQPSVPFIPLKGPAFYQGIYHAIQYSGYISSHFEMVDETGRNYTMGHSGIVSDHTSMYLPVNTSMNDTYLLPRIPLLPEFIAVIASGNGGYSWSLTPFSVVGHYENGFYGNISEPFIISHHFSVSSLYINSSSATEEEVDNYLKNKAAYTPGISEQNPESDWLMVAVLATVLLLAAILSFALLYRKRKATVK